MSKKTQKSLVILAAVFCLLSIQLYFAVPPARGADNPHNRNNNTPIDCVDCHNDAEAAAKPDWWTNQEANVCGRCHNTAMDGIDVVTHKIDNNNILAQCTTCHDPHKQMQFRQWKAGSYLDSGVISSIDATRKIITSSTKTWTNDEWKGMVLFPNVNTPAYNYRIAGNTDTTITIEDRGTGDNVMSNAAVGQTFAITYGKLIKAAINNKYVKFFRSEGPNSFADGDTTINGICQVCHTTTKYFLRDGSVIDAGHANYASAGSKCTTCHNHQVGFKADCAACHGYPPVDAGTMVSTDGSVLGTTNSATAGAHTKHATGGGSNLDYECRVCHGDNAGAGKHNTAGNKFVITMGFEGRARDGVVSQSSYSGQSGVLYDSSSLSTTVTATSTMTCSTIYCHSTAQAPDGGSGPTYRTPVWDALGSMNCGSCHVDMDSDAAATGSHTKHAQGAINYECATCHNGYTEGTTAAATHVNNQINLSFSGQANGTVYSQGNAQSVGNGYGTCSSSACHSSGQAADGSASPLTYGTPAWGGGINCGGCHKNMDTDVTSPGSHKKHAYDNPIGCATCHSGYSEDSVDPATHNKGSVNLGFSGDGAGTIYSQGDIHPLGDGYGSCSSASCHSSAQNESDGTAAPVSYATVTWGSGALGCDGCHKNMDTDPAASGSHTKHAQGTANIACATCHSGYTESSYGATHADGTVNVSAGDYTGGTTPGDHLVGGGYGSCSTASCHSSAQNETDGTMTPPIVTATVTWGSGALGCDGCHKNMDTDPAASGSHTKHAQGTANIACATCHSGYTESSYGATHADGTVNVSAGDYTGGTTAGDHAVGGGYGSCSTASCHNSAQNETDGTLNPPISYGTVVWGSGALGCDGCHKNMDTDPAASGSHTKHAQGTANIACATCHSGYTESSYGITHADGTVNVSVGDYTGGTTAGDHAVGGGYGSCSTASCHSTVQGDNAAPGTTVVTPAWGTVSACGACHAAAPATGSHTKHLAAVSVTCGSCHATAGDGSAMPSSNHLNNNIDVANGYPMPNLIGDNTYSTCSSASCHVSAYNSSLIESPAWGTAAGCGTCHPVGAAGAPETGSHTKHLAILPTPDCSACHDGATIQAPANGGSAHIDGDIDVTNGYPATAKHTAGTYIGTCSTASCHADQYSETTVTTPVWGETSGCASCHKDGGAFAANGGPATGSHTKHLESVFHMPLCGDCHAGAVKNTTGGDNHADSNIDMAVGDYPTDITKHASGSGYSACSTAYCHSTGQSLTDGNSAVASYATVTWNDPATGACGTCHKALKADVAAVNSGSHAAHLNATGVAGCGNCHTGVENDGSLYSSNTASHIDGMIDVSTALTYTGSGAPGNGYATCQTASCHDNGRGVPAPYTPLWGTVITDCSECHERQPSTGSHPTHLSTTQYNKPVCGDCHDGAVEATTAPSTHLDGNVDVFDENNTTPNTDLGYLANVAKHNDDTYSSCTTAYCHSSGQSLDGLSATPVYATVTWNGTAACGTCHKTKSGDPLGAIDTGSHSKHMNYTVKDPAVGCGDCHTGATSSSYNSTNHVNRTIDLVSGNGYTLAGAPGNGYDSCTTSYCHSNGKLTYQSAAWSVSVSPGCTFCHPTLSGAHSKHVVFTNSAVYGSTAVNVSSSTTSYDFGCGNCHPTAVTSHMNGSVDLSLAAADGGYLKSKNVTPSITGSGNSTQCSGVYCHSNGQATATFQQTPVWSGGFDANNSCGQCHGNSPASGAHAAHVVGIHYKSIYNGTLGKIASSGTAGSGAGHGDPAVSTTINCNICHSATLSKAQNKFGSACNSCHSGDGAANAIVSADLVKTMHVNGDRNVAFAAVQMKSRAQIRSDITTVAELDAYWQRTNNYKAGVTSHDLAKTTLAATAAYAGGTCSTVACHNGNSITWTELNVTCKSCHTALP